MATATVNRFGTTLSENSVVKTATQVLKPASHEKLAKQHLPENGFTLQTLVQKEAVVGNFQWTTATASGGKLAMYNNPWDLLTTAATSGPFDIASAARFDVRLRVQVTGQKFQTGMLIIAWAPLTSQNSIYPTATLGNQLSYGNVTSLSAFRHVTLSASKEESAELFIPFVNPQGYLDVVNPAQTGKDSLGTIVIAVLAPLQVSTGATNYVSVNVMAQIVNATFKIPAPTISSSLVPIMRLDENRDAVRNTGIIEKLRRKYRFVPSSVFGEEPTVVGEGQMMALAKNVVSGFAEKFLPQEIVKNGLGITMDKPNSTIQPGYLIRKPVRSMAYGVGGDCMERLHIDPGQQNLSVAEHFGTGANELSVSKMVQIPMIKKISTWDTSMAEGTVLYQSFVAPMATTYGTPQSFPAGQVGVLGTFQPTYLDYGAMKYSYWRGGIKQKLSIVASQFHQGKLQVSFHPFQTNIPSSVAQAAGQYTSVITLGPDKTEFTWEFPFRCAKPWLRVPNGANGISATNLLDFVTGTMQIKVLNQLTASTGCPTSIYIILWEGGASDMEFSGLHGNNVSVMPAYSVDWVQGTMKKDDDEEVIEGEGQMGSIIIDDETNMKNPSMESPVPYPEDGAQDGNAPPIETAPVEIAVEPEAADTGEDRAAEISPDQERKDYNIKVALTEKHTYGQTHFGRNKEYMNMKSLMSIMTKIFVSSIGPFPQLIRRALWPDATFPSVTAMAFRVTPMREPNTTYGVDNYTTPTTGELITQPEFPGVGRPRGMISHWADIFRLWRGSMKYAALFDISVQTGGEARPFAMFIPNGSPEWTTSFPYLWQLGTTTPFIVTGTLSSIPIQIISYIKQSLMDISAVVPVNNDPLLASFNGAQETPHITWGDKGATYLEFEVPYWSEYHTKMCGNDTMCARGQQMPNGLSNQTGFVILGLANVDANHTVSPAGGVGAITIFQSVGDDFSMGVMLPPPPQMLVGGYSIVPPVAGSSQIIPYGQDRYIPTLHP